MKRIDKIIFSEWDLRNLKKSIDEVKRLKFNSENKVNNKKKRKTTFDQEVA